MTSPFDALVQKLKSLDTGLYDGEYLGRLCRSVVGSFLDELKDADSDNFPVEISSIVGTIVIRAASSNIDPSGLKQILFGSSGKEYPVGRILLEAYSERHGELTEGPLRTISWKYPQLIDVDWRLSEFVESNLASSGGKEQPMAEITLTSLETGQTETKNFTFVCTKQQIQDMQWKIKETLNLLQKMATTQ